MNSFRAFGSAESSRHGAAVSIASFLANGHEYHLYVYEEIENAPQGTVLKAADEILPESMIFQYRSHPSHAGFSNFFRYKLLLSRGGWWVDTDVVCLKPFAFGDPYVFASERVGGHEVPTTAVLKAPPGSEIMAFNWEICRSCPDPTDVVWGEHGPQADGESDRKIWAANFDQRARTFSVRLPMTNGRRCFRPRMRGLSTKILIVSIFGTRCGAAAAATRRLPTLRTAFTNGSRQLFCRDAKTDCGAENGVESIYQP